MAVGKSKCLIKDGREEARRTAVGPFSQKDRCDAEVPVMANVRSTGNTLVMGTQGSEIASGGLRRSCFRSEPS